MKKITIFSIAVFTLILASCGTSIETKKPNYPRQVKKWMDIQYLTYRGPWQGPDGFPITGYSLKVLPTRRMHLINEYILKNQWCEPAYIFLAVAGDEETLAVKYYNRVDFYTNGQGSTVLSYKFNQRIADLWFVDGLLIVLWNDVNRSGSFDTWSSTKVVRVGIDIWNPNTKTVMTTLDVPCKKATPFLLHTIGAGSPLFNPVCKDNGRVLINDGTTVSLYSIYGEKIQVVYEIEGEIWKCFVDGDELILEDRVYSTGVFNKKVIPIR